MLRNNRGLQTLKQILVILVISEKNVRHPSFDSFEARVEVYVNDPLVRPLLGLSR